MVSNTTDGSRCNDWSSIFLRNLEQVGISVAENAAKQKNSAGAFDDIQICHNLYMLKSWTLCH